MATRAEQVRGFIMDSQKPLRLAGGFEPALDLLSFPCRPVRPFDAIVQPFVRSMDHGQPKLA